MLTHAKFEPINLKNVRLATLAIVVLEKFTSPGEIPGVQKNGQNALEDTIFVSNRFEILDNSLIEEDLHAK